MIPDQEHTQRVAQALADAAMHDGQPAPPVAELESALGRIAAQQARNLLADAGPLLRALADVPETPEEAT